MKCYEGSHGKLHYFKGLTKLRRICGKTRCDRKEETMTLQDRLKHLHRGYDGKEYTPIPEAATQIEQDLLQLANELPKFGYIHENGIRVDYISVNELRTQIIKYCRGE